MNHKHICIILFQVSNNREKLNAMIRIAQESFNKKNPLLIRLPHQKALEYVDTLLWRSPKDSFLPHVVTDNPCQDLIVLTTSETNPNQAHTIFNLCVHPVLNEDLFFTRIYEFENNKKKDALDQKRYQRYRSQGYSIHLSS